MKTTIPIKKYAMDETLSWEESYRQLEAHHLEEVGFLVTRIEQFEAVVDLAREVRRGCQCDYDYRCSNCAAICKMRDALCTVDPEP